MTTKILIAEDDVIVMNQMTLELQSKMDNISIDYAKDYNLLTTKIKYNSYDLLILSLETPGMENKNLIHELKGVKRDLKILLFSSYYEELVLQYIREGVDGYLCRDTEENKIVLAVDTMLKNGYYYPYKLVSLMAKEKKILPIDKLTPRELQVFNLMAEGYSNVKIAELLNVNMSTVTTHKKTIFDKLKINNKAQLINIKNSMH